MFLIFNELTRFARYRDWHFGKIPLLFNMLFIIWLQSIESVSVWEAFKWYIIFSTFLAFAYMINNISDIEIDGKVGKVTELRNWSLTAKLVITIIFGIFGFAFAALYLDRFSLFILGVSYALAWIYSFPPRFKEHIWIGPIVASAGQLCIPAIVILVAYRYFSLCTICYVILTFLWGLRMLIVHQIIDSDNDLATGVKTTVLSIGIESSYKLLRYIFVCELIFVAIQFILLLQNGLGSISLILLVFPLIYFACRWRFKLSIRLDTYEYIPLADVYEMYLPIALAISIIINSKGDNWWTLVLIFLLFGSRYWNRLISSYYSFIDHNNTENKN